MPFDGLFTGCIVNELQKLVGTRIDKIHQPAIDEIIFNIKKDKKQLKLLLCVNPSFPRIHLTELVKENPTAAPGFCMMLRKHISGAKITAIEQQGLDRIVKFEFESRDELGFNKTYKLIIEIMGKHSNLVLTDSSNIIVDAVKHLDSSMNRFREVLPGLPYVYPPGGDKLNPLLSSSEDFNRMLSVSDTVTIAKFLQTSFMGISTTFAHEVSPENFDQPIVSVKPMDMDEIRNRFFYYISRYKSKDFTPIVYFKEGSMSDYYMFKLETYMGLQFKNFDTFSELLDYYYSQKDFKNIIKTKYHDLLKTVSNLIQKDNKKLAIYEEKLFECKDFEKWKVYGDLIMANSYSIEDGAETAELVDFYSESSETITVPLDKELNAIQNGQKYYKRYSRERDTIEAVKKQREECHSELDYLEGIVLSLDNASETETIEEIRRELIESGFIKKKRNLSKLKPSSPHHYRSSDGYDIYVGKNNNQNDYLTLRFAVSSDIWMHTKNIPGSHVIIKSSGGMVSDTALLEGALLAAYYSKARESATVPVDYSEKKNVKKPSGAKPGMVIYYTNKTIYVTPSEEKINSIVKIDG